MWHLAFNWQRVSSIFNSIIQTSESQLAFEGLIDGSHNAVCHLALEAVILKNYENHREINNSLVGHKVNWIPNILFLLPLSTVYCHYDRKKWALETMFLPWNNLIEFLHVHLHENAQKSVKLNESSFDNVFSLPCIYLGGVYLHRL